MPDLINSSPALFTRFWVLCLLESATRVGLAPAGRPQIFALAYLANAVADAFHADAVQRAVLRNAEGPILAEVALELDRLTGLGLCNITRVAETRKSSVLRSQYYISNVAKTYLDEACARSSYFESVRNFHRQVADGFSDLGVPSIVDGSKAEASYSDLSVGVGEVIDLGEFETVFPTLKAIAAVQKSLPEFRDRTAYGAIQVYGRYLSHMTSPHVAETENLEDSHS